jgi:hypothetical protein
MKINSCVVLMTVVLCTTALADDLVLTTPTQREDNSPLGLSEIAGIGIYCGTSAESLGERELFYDAVTLPETVIPASLFDFPGGAWLCRATVKDIDGRESKFSNMFALQIDMRLPPKAPGIEPNTTVDIVK